MKIDIFYDTPVGIRLFLNITSMYFKIHKIYPTTDSELPIFLNNLGYTCQYKNIKPPISPIERVGITMEEEVATALILTYG